MTDAKQALESELRNLTAAQVALLKFIAKGPQLLPYGDPNASALLLRGLARRSTSFGKLQITGKGRRVLDASNEH